MLDEATWQVAYRASHPGRALPAAAPRLLEGTGWIAQLGGFLGRNRDGLTTLWRGWRRLEDPLAGYRLSANIAPQPPPC